MSVRWTALGQCPADIVVAGVQWAATGASVPSAATGVHAAHGVDEAGEVACERVTVADAAWAGGPAGFPGPACRTAAEPVAPATDAVWRLDAWVVGSP